MPKKIPTSERIVNAARSLFNEKGYAATTLNEIAAKVGISQGNLSYHFPAKLDLVRRIEAETREQLHTKRSQLGSDAVAEDYVNHVLFTMNLIWVNRFLLRDRAQLDTPLKDHLSELAANFEDFLALLIRAEKSGMIRRNAINDINDFARALWITGRYWMDYLRECEARTEIAWEDQARGIEIQFATLLPCLTASARKEFEAALASAKRTYEQSATQTLSTSF